MKSCVMQQLQVQDPSNFLSPRKRLNLALFDPGKSWETVLKYVRTLCRESSAACIDMDRD